MQRLTINGKSRVLKITLAVGLMAGFGLASMPSLASSCKGQVESTCKTDASCSWVDSYSRKDGTQVKGFCRTKSAPKSTKASKPELSSASKD